jgi:multidrug efflux pump subunit AcrA (membrane-fusion protein)
MLVALLTGCGKPDSDDAKPTAARAPASISDTDDTSPGVTLKKDAQARAGLKIEPLAGHRLQPESIAYGRLEEDPSAAFVMRAPFAGTLHTAENGEWPAVGQTIAAGSAAARIEPRLTLTDRLGVNTQLTSARADLNASAAAVAAAQTAYDRARALNADNKNISDRAMQEAGAKLAAEQAREAGARALITTLENSLAPPSGAAAGMRPIVAERGGDVVEVLAQPGESIEQGAPIARLTRFDRLLVRIDLSVGERLPGDAGTVRIVPAGFENQAPLTAKRVGIAAATDAHTQGLSLLYRLVRTFPGLRPGTAVTAHFSVPGTAANGVLIPRAAMVQQDGRIWVFVQTKDDHFSRRPVPLDLPAEAGFMAAHGFSPGDRIVVAGAQTLLSEEFKSRNAADTN